MDLKGKVALVTGSSRGIGKTIAHELAREGCKVIVHGSRDSDASLSAILCAPVQSARLYDLDGSGAVENLAAKIKAYWREHLAVESAD